MDKLEKFIKDNRKALNAYEPDPAIWDNIRKPGRYSVRKIFNRAAMIIILIGTTIGITLLAGKVINLPGQTKMANDNSELKETELFYNNKLNILMEEAQPFLTANPDIERELMIDINLLDSICMDIKEDLKDNISNQEVIEALILNFRIKVEILEEMLEILDSQENNGKVDNI
jgi:hypothetical protein